MDKKEKEIALKQLRLKQKEARKRLNEMKADGLGNGRTVKDALGAWYVVTKRDNFTIPRGITDGRKINAMNNALDKFLASKWTTEEGRADIRKKMRESLGNELHMTDKEVNGLLDIFSDTVYDDFRELAVGVGSTFVFPELGKLNSETIVDEEGNIKKKYSHDDIMSALKYAVSKKDSIAKARGGEQFNALMDTIHEYLEYLKK